MAKADPFYIIRGEVTESLNEVQQKLSRFHGLMATNPERKSIAKQVESECDSVSWQLNELTSAVEVAAESPERFNLTMEELNSRRRWIESTQRQIKGVKEGLRAAIAAPALQPVENRYHAANDKYLADEGERQQLLTKKQDDALDEIEQHVNRIGRMGRAIGEELEGQERLLTELDQDMDTTHSRLKATHRRMTDLIRKSGGNKQLCVIIFLIVVLIVLMTLAFS